LIPVIPVRCLPWFHALIVGRRGPFVRSAPPLADLVVDSSR
jgi:hypothetical protein